MAFYRDCIPHRSGSSRSLTCLEYSNRCYPTRNLNASVYQICIASVLYSKPSVLVNSYCYCYNSYCCMYLVHIIPAKMYAH